jgi:carboxypeptidase Taq
VRITTRFSTDNLVDALGSTMHEAGHGLYEQGLPAAEAGTPRGRAVSLGIHESQSRLWENHVGRSRAFWTFCAPLVHEVFGSAVASYDATAMFGAANRVRPDLIRVEADEATYDLHVVIRFELELALVRGELAVADLPEAWNLHYRNDLGVTVADDGKGCLQDVHWSCGLFGYFPTYTLGNLYAAQLFEAAQIALPDLDEQIAAGEFGALRGWLHQNIHAEGSRLPAGRLCEQATGKPLGMDPMLRHLEGKLLPVYQL